MQQNAFAGGTVSPLDYIAPDIAQQQRELQRQQQLADILRAQAMTPIDTGTNMVGGWAVKNPTGANALQKLGEALLARNAQGRVDTGLSALSGAFQQQFNGGGMGGGSASTGAAQPGGQMPTAGAGAPAGFPTEAEYNRAGLLAALGLNGPMEALKQRAEIAMKGVPSAPPEAYYANQAGIAPGTPESGAVYARLLTKSMTGTGMRPGSQYTDAAGNLQIVPDIGRGIQAGYGPNGLTMGAIPGSGALANLAGENAGRVAAAKAPYDFVNVTTGSGASVPVSTADLAAGRIPGATSAMPATAAGPGAPAAPVVPAPAAPAATPMKVDPWANIPKVPTVGGIGQTTYGKGVAEQRAGMVQETAKELANAASTGNARLSYIDQAIKALPNASTGPGAMNVAGLQKLLIERFNMDPDVLKDVANGNADATAVLNKNLLNFATQSASALYGKKMTQGEVKLQIEQASPNTDMTHGAIAYLLAAEKARAQRDVQKATDYGRYINAGGDPLQFEGWHSNAFPEAAAVSAGTAPLSGVLSGKTVKWTEMP